MIVPTVIDLYRFELNYYPFIVYPDQCSRDCNAVDDLSRKICVPSKTKDIHVKVFNLKTKANEANTFVKHISCNCKCKFNSIAGNSNRKGNIRATKIIVGIVAH